MKSDFPLPLAAGLILNLVRLLIINSDAEKWLQKYLHLPHWTWHFVGGLTCGLMLWGLILMCPQAVEKLHAFKTHLFGR